MDVLTERTCPDCHGTGCILQPGDCDICGGTGAVPAMSEIGSELREAVQAERERIAAWLEAKAAQMGDHEIPYALQIAAQSIRNGSYERTLELRDLPGDVAGG
jgi:DnaJ-class molecular chaperone